MKSLVCILFLACSFSAFAGTFSTCENDQFQLVIHANPDPSSTSIFTHMILILQKDGGVPLMAPVNATQGAGEITYSSLPQFTFSLTINDDGKGVTNISGEEKAVVCK